MSDVLVELAFIALEELDRGQQAQGFHRPRIHGKSLGDVLLCLVVLFRIDVLLGSEQVALDEVRVDRQRVLELRAGSLGIGHRQISGHTEMRFRHVGIDFQRILITGESFRLVVFLRKQVAPAHKGVRIARIALRGQFEDIVRIMKPLRRPQRAGDENKIVWRTYASILEARDQFVVDGLRLVSLACTFQNRCFFELRRDGNIRSILNGVEMRQSLIEVPRQMMDPCRREPNRRRRGIPSRPCLKPVARLYVLALSNPGDVKALDHLRIDVPSGNNGFQGGRRFFILAGSRLLDRSRHVGLPQSPTTEEKKTD